MLHSGGSAKLIGKLLHAVSCPHEQINEMAACAWAPQACNMSAACHLLATAHVNMRMHVTSNLLSFLH